VVRTLVDARLLTAGDDTVEVAHEALIREWPRLRGWLEENRAGLEVHHRLTEAADEWVELGREPAALLRGSRLLTTREWADQHPGDLNALEREFVDASVESESNELEEASARARRLRLLSAGLALVAVLALAAAIFGVDRSLEAADQRDTAEREARAALSGSLAAQSAAELDDRLDLSMLTALEAYRQEQSPQAREALLRAIGRGAPQVKQMHGHTDSVRSLAFSGDGARLASGSQDGSARVWDVARGTQIGEPLVEGLDRAPRVAITPDASVIGVAGSGAITLFDADSREQAARWEIPSRTIASAAASGDGRIFAFRGIDLSLYVIDVQGRRILRRPRASGPGPLGIAVGGLALSDDGDHLAMLDRAGFALWRLGTSGSLLRVERVPLEGAVGFFPEDEPDFDAAGRVVAVRGSNGRLRRWDVDTGRRLADGTGVGGGYGISVVDLDTGTLAVTGETADTLEIRREGRRAWTTDQVIGALAIAPGGERLAAGGERGTIELWDTTRHVAFATPVDSLSAISIAVDANGDVLAAGQFDGTIGLWNARTGEVIEREFAPAQPREYVGWIAFSPGGNEITAVYSRRGRLTARILPRAASDRPAQPIALSEFQLAEEIDFPELSPDGATLAWVHEDEIRIWSIRDNQARAVRAIDGVSVGAPFHGLAFSADSRTIVAWGDRAVALLRADGSGEPVRLPDLGAVSDAAVSPDIVAVGLANGGLRLWDRRTRRPVGRELGGSSGGRLEFSPDGSRLVAVGGTMDVWDVRAGRQVAQGLSVTPETEVGHQIAFAGDPPTLVAKGEERPYIVDPIVFATDLAAFEERVCAVANRNLRRDELLSFPADRELGRCVS
jgi:WD40 repeat protein